jgi:hypothetical protein
MSFPLSPSNNDLYTNGLGTQYKYDSTRTAWVINGSGITGGIAGSGTAPYIPVFSDSTTLANSPAYVAGNGLQIDGASSYALVSDSSVKVSGNNISGPVYYTSIEKDKILFGFDGDLNGRVITANPAIALNLQVSSSSKLSFSASNGTLANLQSLACNVGSTSRYTGTFTRGTSKSYMAQDQGVLSDNGELIIIPSTAQNIYATGFVWGYWGMSTGMYGQTNFSYTNFGGMLFTNTVASLSSTDQAGYLCLLADSTEMILKANTLGVDATIGYCLNFWRKDV